MSKLDKSNDKVIKQAVENMEVPVMGIMQRFEDEHGGENIGEQELYFNIKVWLPAQIKRERIEAQIEVLERIRNDKDLIISIEREIDRLKEQL